MTSLFLGHCPIL